MVYQCKALSLMYDTIAANCVQNCTAILPCYPHDQDENSNTLAPYALPLQENMYTHPSDLKCLHGCIKEVL